MSRRFAIKTHLTAEEVVEFDRIREWHGLCASALARMYIRSGMAADSKALPAGMLRNGPKWTANVRPFGRGTN